MFNRLIKRVNVNNNFNKIIIKKCNTYTKLDVGCAILFTSILVGTISYQSFTLYELYHDDKFKKTMNEKNFSKYKKLTTMFVCTSISGALMSFGSSLIYFSTLVHFKKMRYTIFFIMFGPVLFVGLDDIINNNLLGIDE